MADGYSPWNEASRSLGGFSDTINQVALGLAQQRFREQLAMQQMALRQQQLQQQQQLYGAHEKLYSKQGALYAAQEMLNKQKTKDLVDKATAGGMLGDVLEQLVNPIPNMQPGTEQLLRGMAAGQAGRLSAMGQQHVPVNITQILQGLTDPRMSALMATGSRIQQSMPSQSIALDVQTGAPSYISPQKLTPGQSLVEGVSGQPIATAPGRPTPERVQQSVGSLGNILGNFMVGGVPIAPEDPVYQATTNALQALLPQLVPQGTNAPAARTDNSPRAKAQLANEIARQNPTWTRQQVIEEVNRRLP